MAAKLVDEKCTELAEHFLRDEGWHPDAKGNLAAAIQNAVEDWFEFDAKDYRAEKVVNG